MFAGDAEIQYYLDICMQLNTSPETIIYITHIPNLVGVWEYETGHQKESK